MADPYLTGICRWWHLTIPSAELLAAGAAFACTDVTRLPLRAGAADLLLDRGCFYYLPAGDRASYAAEAWRVLRPGGRLLLRMCLNSAGAPNGLDENTVRTAFRGWRLTALDRRELVSDTRTMPAIMAILVRGKSMITDDRRPARHRDIRDDPGHN